MKKGFTLVELLAVIVILAVISLIAYAVIQKNIDVTRKSSYETSVKNMIEAAKEYVVTNYEENDFPEGGIDIANNELNIKNSEFISGIITKNEDGAIEVVNLTDGHMCANGTKNDLEITYGTCEASDTTPPSLEIKVLKKTANRVRFLVKVQDAQSGLKELKYSYNGKEEVLSVPDKRGMVKKIVEVTGLDAGVNYNFKFTVVNNHATNDEKLTTTVKEKEVRLPEVEEPMFKVSSGTYATTKILTITYPEVEGYEFTYQIGDKAEVTLDPGKYEVSQDIAENTLVKAFIRKDGQEVLSSKLMIAGLDLEPPTTKVFIEDRDSWTLEKKVYAKATDTGAGLALRGYSYNRKKSWVNTEDDNLLTVLKENQKFKVFARDKVGNIQNQFYLCEDKNFENCTLIEGDIDGTGSSYTISRIDNVGPIMEIKVIEGELGANNWYISDRIVIELIIKDIAWRLDDDGNKVEMPGCGIKRASVKMNNKDVDLSHPYSGSFENNYVVYRMTLTENNVYKFTFDSEDNLGNKTDGDFDVKLDNVRPTMSAPESFTGGGVATNSLVKTKCGPSGDTTVCNPSSVAAYRRTNVTCTGTCGNGLSITNSYSIGYYYSARANYKTDYYDCSYQTCGSRQVCYTANYTNAWFDGYCDRIETLIRQECYTESCCCEWHSRTCSRTVFSHYDCPSSGSLSGSTCYF